MRWRLGLTGTATAGLETDRMVWVLILHAEAHVLHARSSHAFRLC